MQKIVRIARLELSVLFYSPIAWLVLIIFTIQSGITYTEQLYAQETNQQLERVLQVLSKVLFAGDDGMLKSVMDNLYLYIPLLTMGLLSRETSSGSIKLLLSSPVTVREIVFGKFLAMMVYGLILVFILLGYTMAAYFSISSLDVKFVMGGIFGLYLLICAYTAIGLFMSSLTSYQVVAAISTLAILAGLNFIGEIGQDYDFIRGLTYWLSMDGRTENMLNGMITSKDFIYFILVIIFFLVLTIMKLNSGREIRTAGNSILRYSFVMLVFMSLGYISSLPKLTAYFDTTRFKDRTLTENSQELLKRIKTPVTLTTYNNVVHYFAAYGAPKNRISDMSRFEQYQRFLPALKMDYVHYYDNLTGYNDTTKTLEQRAKKAAEALGFNYSTLLNPKQIKKKIDLMPEQNSFVRMLSFDGKQTPLRMFDDMFVYPNEGEVMAAFKRLLEGPAKVGVLTGNDERSIHTVGDKAYKYITNGLSIRGSLINQGFDVADIDIDKFDTLPDSLSVLILADPTLAFTEVQQKKLAAYIDKGGNLLIAGEPGRQHILNPILSKIGVAITPGTVFEESENFEPELIQASFTPQASQDRYSFYDKAVVTFNGVAALSYTNDGEFKKMPILQSNIKQTWNTINVADETSKASTMAVSITRKLKDKEQKIIVFSDADFMSNVELTRNNINTVNSIFVMRMFKWFSDDKYPVSGKRPKSIDTEILVSRKQINIQKTVFLGVLPLLIGICGSMVLVRRKRK